MQRKIQGGVVYTRVLSYSGNEKSSTGEGRINKNAGRVNDTTYCLGSFKFREVFVTNNPRFQFQSDRSHFDSPLLDKRNYRCVYFYSPQKQNFRLFKAQYFLYIYFFNFLFSFSSIHSTIRVRTKETPTVLHEKKSKNGGKGIITDEKVRMRDRNRRVCNEDEKKVLMCQRKRA